MMKKRPRNEGMAEMASMNGESIAVWRSEVWRAQTLGLGWYEVGVDWTMMDENSLSNGILRGTIFQNAAS
ncbi:hypothetical protein CapIbe_021702 [Capra ibex]